MRTTRRVRRGSSRGTGEPIPTDVRVRTIERAGTWWAEAPNGAWARWSDIFGEWEPIEGLPPGLEPPPPGAEALPSTELRAIAPTPRQTAPDAEPGTGPMASDYIGTLFRLIVPALLLGLALPLLFLLSLRFLFLSRAALPPPDNVKAILMFSLVAGVFVAGAIMVARRLPSPRFGDPARWGLTVALVAMGLPVAWLASGTQWSGGAGSKAATLAVVLLMGLAVETLHRRGAFAWFRSGRRAGRPVTGPA
jgi:hypothetical protein